MRKTKMLLRTLGDHIPIMQSHKKPSSIEFLNFKFLKSIHGFDVSSFVCLFCLFCFVFVLFHSQGKLLTSLIEASIIDERKFLQKYGNKNVSYVPKVPFTKFGSRLIFLMGSHVNQLTYFSKVLLVQNHHFCHNMNGILTSCILV